MEISSSEAAKSCLVDSFCLWRDSIEEPFWTLKTLRLHVRTANDNSYDVWQSIGISVTSCLRLRAVNDISMFCTSFSQQPLFSIQYQTFDFRLYRIVIASLQLQIGFSDGSSYLLTMLVGRSLAPLDYPAC